MSNETTAVAAKPKVDLSNVDDFYAWKEFVKQCRGDATALQVGGRMTAPDLDDPATQGCMLALVRKALGGHKLNIAILEDGSASIDDDLYFDVRGDSCKRQNFARHYPTCPQPAPRLTAVAQIAALAKLPDQEIRESTNAQAIGDCKHDQWSRRQGVGAVAAL